jgi:riboflavin biosynthesis pyrimidine reductase
VLNSAATIPHPQVACSLALDWRCSMVAEACSEAENRIEERLGRERMMPELPAFAAFAARKTREAEQARIATLATAFHARGSAVRGVGNAWTRAHYGGEFDLCLAPPDRAALSLVFVQSNDGNTGAGDPSALGGGTTDTHLIYEGLCRVAADGVLAGARTVHQQAFFSVWHPELVELRRSLGLARHPAQIVISRMGRLDFDAILFNVPDVPVFLLGGTECLTRCEVEVRQRPWIRCLPLVGESVADAIHQLSSTHGIRRISCVGGRFTASSLVDAGVAQDLYLTTAPQNGGEPGTPWYSGANPPKLELVTRKHWSDDGSPIVFEHFLIDRPAAA